MIEDLKKIYSGKKVFLTGHTGFKGSWMLKILNMLGADVKGYALSPVGTPNLFDVINGDQICESVIADLRDRDRLKDEVESFQPDFIFHLAAQPLVRLSYKIPSETFEVNAIGTANVLDALMLVQKPCYCVFITTDKVYHNNEWDYPYRENDRLGGYDPYSASKACAELVIDSYRNSFFNIKDFDKHKKAIAVGRAGNVIGGGDWSADRLIPDIVRSLEQGKEVEIRNPGAVRPWQHVLEPLAGYLLLGAKLFNDPQSYSTAYNFGPDVNDALPVNKMVEMSIEAWGTGSYFIHKNENQPHEAGLLKLDVSKAKAELGWLPRLNAGKAVENTIKWYKQYYHSGDLLKYTENEIEDFLNG
ncbi:CDP-glucose 4,6-dehydratase [Mucilaginibacter pallidiroseus]|uniref:CDP-glucose 4,6-dehydratase n=2 Tax=Mucilaginibacter pallidiroseus TaxID=2599295 RepID=A0A563UK25_9SPHI|nr:CDP-glucose 4,6-dehydratase [Mucilaginibacter pallidiroseus]